MSGRYDSKAADRWWEAFARDYELMDRHVGEMARGADEDTLIVVVSDHGHIMGTAKVEPSPPPATNTTSATSGSS